MSVPHNSLPSQAARRAIEKLQRERPKELFPGANGTNEYLACGHEQQSRGVTWESKLVRECKEEHVGRCMGCKHCTPFTEADTRLWTLQGGRR